MSLQLARRYTDLIAEFPPDVGAAVLAELMAECHRAGHLGLPVGTHLAMIEAGIVAGRADLPVAGQGG